MNTSTTDTTQTPRTDEACEAMGLKAFVVPVETSRQLERELAEKSNEVARLREIVERYRVWATSENPTQMELDNLKQKYDELN